MIDTDKYEGHTPPPWKVRTHYDTTCVCYSKDDDSECSFVKIHEEHENEQDAQLIADAPLLLKEVKWLRSLIQMVSYDLEWNPDKLDQNKRQLEYNVQKWEKKEMIE